MRKRIRMKKNQYITQNKNRNENKSENKNADKNENKNENKNKNKNKNKSWDKDRIYCAYVSVNIIAKPPLNGDVKVVQHSK